MNTRIDLEKYEAMYDAFDGGHGRSHIERVRNLAVKLATIYAPDKVELAYVAATLHDIGLAQGRDNHEINGAAYLLKEQPLIEAFSSDELNEIAEAVREHRASSGNPQSILAKIISDADKVSDSTPEAMQRAYEFGKAHFPNLTDEQQIMRAAEHLKEKFGPEGTGSRMYFPESKAELENVYGPIFRAVDAKDFPFLQSLITS